MIIRKTLKDQLSYISSWKKISEPSFRNKYYFSLHVNNDIVEKYRLKSNIIGMEYVITRKWISFSPTSTIYDLDFDDLMIVAKDNSMKIIYIPVYFNFVNDYIFIAKKLREQDINIIPLDDMILVQTDEKYIEYNGDELLIEEIK